MRQANPGLDPEKALKDWKQAATHADPWTRYDCQLVTPLYGGGVMLARSMQPCRYAPRASAANYASGGVVLPAAPSTHRR